MALTVINTPPVSGYATPLAPAYNDIEYLVSSNQSAQPGFYFIVTITDVASSDSYTYKINATNTNECYFNSSEIARKYVKNFYPYSFPAGPYNQWNVCVDGIKKFQVVFTEYYSGATHATTTEFFYAWNASLTKNERRTYSMNSYIVSGVDNSCWLNTLENHSLATGRTIVNSNQDYVIYILNFDTTYFIDMVIVNFYTSANVFISSQTINNPYNPSTDSNKYVCINVGTSGLNIPSGTDHYSVSFLSSPNSYGSVHNFYIKNCDQKNFGLLSVGYLNRFGAYDSYTFYGNHERFSIGEKSYYKQLRPKFEGSHTNLGADTSGGLFPKKSRLTLSSTYENEIVLKSDWLSVFEMGRLQDLISSPHVFINQYIPLVGNTYREVVVQDVRYAYRNVAAKQQQMIITVNESITEQRQME